MNRDIIKPCPFCGGEPSIVERPDNIDGTEFFYALVCYCGGYSACAHKMAVRKTPAQAKADAIAAWNRRAPAPAAQGPSGAEPVAQVYSMFPVVPGAAEKLHVSLLKQVPAGTKLYATPQPPAALVQLTDAQVAKLGRVGPVYAPDGVVSRRPLEYQRELESQFRRGLRAGEVAHGITGATDGKQT